MASLDMSLDDMIKSRRTTDRGRGRGRARGGGGRGQGRSFGGGRPTGPPRKGPLAVNARPSAYTIAKSFRRPKISTWQQGLFEESLKAVGFDNGARLNVSNLDIGVTNEDIRELFSEIGELKRYAIHYDKNGRPSGSAEVLFARRSDAFQALKRYNNVQLDGKPMKIEIEGSNSEILPLSVKSAMTTPVITSPPVEKKKTKRKYQKKKVLAEDEPKPDPYWLESFFGFAPEEAEKIPTWGHCGILSPLLANICLDELDRWMEGKIQEFYRPSKSDVIWNSPEGEVDQGNTSWPEFVPTSGPDKTRKIDYIRFGGHFLIGVRGPRADAAILRKQLIEFCDQKYMLKLDNESLPIEHITKGIMFLDHVLCRRVVYPTLRYTATGGKIISEKGVGTLLSVTASLKQCIKQFRKLGFLKGDRDPDPQPCFRMFHATQAHTNAQMNKLLSTMVEWYRFADNRKKIVNFCSYIIRGSLAKLYAAKYKLRSRAKVYKIGDRTLRRPLKEKKGQSPEYNNLLRMGLAESIEGLQYTRMSLVPETDYSPFPVGWKPDHEKALIEYIKLDDPKTLEQNRTSLIEEGLISPQDYISMLVWNYKRSAGINSELLVGSGVEKRVEEDEEENEESEEQLHVRNM